MSQTHNYHYGSEADQYTFYRLPKALFTNERYKDISDGAKILYGLCKYIQHDTNPVRNGNLTDSGADYHIHSVR